MVAVCPVVISTIEQEYFKYESLSRSTDRPQLFACTGEKHETFYMCSTFEFQPACDSRSMLRQDPLKTSDVSGDAVYFIAGEHAAISFPDVPASELTTPGRVANADCGDGSQRGETTPSGISQHCHSVAMTRNWSTTCSE